MEGNDETPFRPRRTGDHRSEFRGCGMLVEQTCGPSGNWQRDGDGNLLVSIPKGWEKSTPDSGAWTTCWTDPEDDSNVLMTTSSIDEDDVYTALDTSADAARSVTPGIPAGRRMHRLVRRHYYSGPTGLSDDVAS